MGIFSSEISANRNNSNKFETLIALQNVLRWLLLHSWFSKFPRGRPPGPPYKRRYMGKFWISFNYPTSAPRRHHPHPLSYWYKNAQIFARHLPMTVYDFVIRGFICSLWAELPIPPPFSPIKLLLLLGYGYCYVKVSFQRFFLLEAVNFID